VSASLRIIDCLPPRRGEPSDPSIRLPSWAWIAIVLAVAVALIFH
jgi:hypothetical protein